MITQVTLKVVLDGDWKLSAEQVAQNVEELLSKNSYSINDVLVDDYEEEEEKEEEKEEEEEE